MTHAIFEIFLELQNQLDRLRLTRPRHYAAVNCVLALALCVAGWGVIKAAVHAISWLGRPSVQSLAERAISASPSDAASAAQDLDRMAAAGNVDAVLIRRVARESRDESVRAMAFSRLASLWDYESMQLLLETLDAESPALRRSAARALAKLLGRDHHFPSQGTPKERNHVREKIAKDWETYRNSKLFQVNKERLKRGTE